MVFLLAFLLIVAPFVPLLLLLGLVGLMWAGGRRDEQATVALEGARFVLRAEHFHCPFRDVEVDLEFSRARTGEAQEAADVLSCSAFPDPSSVTCEKRCLTLLPVHRSLALLHVG